MPIQPGSKVGRYQIKSIIGRGGMAVVYKAVDTRLKRDVAIKFIRMEQFGSNQWVNIRKRFEREALVMAKLDHPHIIKVFDYGEYEGTPYFVMQLVEGGSLKQRIGRPIPWQDAVQQVKPIAEALEYAHSQGVVHRDVKPGNILLTKNGSPLLADFGIAKIVESTSGDSLTSSGVGMGTPEYMAPEQAMGEKVDKRADIYSLGVILYEMITGNRPFRADTPMKVVFKQTTEQLPKPSQIVRNLPGSVDDFLQKTLAKDPATRQADMAAFGRELAALTSGKAPAPRRVIAPARQITPTRRERTVIDQPQQVKKPGVPVWVWGVSGLLVLVVVFSMLSDKSGAPVSKVEVPAVTQSATSAQSPTTTPTQPPTSTPKPVLGIGSSKVSEKDGMTMMYVPQGEFIMGSDKNDWQYLFSFFTVETYQTPKHTVTLDEFWIDKTEVTNSMFVKFLNNQKDSSLFNKWFKTNDQKYLKIRKSLSGNWEVAPGFEEFPIINVSWDGANAFCEWANKRLPTEAEWEKAARSTDGRLFPWGNEPNAKCEYVGNTNCGVDSPAKVSNNNSNESPYGTLDMVGNVWEWVQDYFDADYYKNSPLINPVNLSPKTYFRDSSDRVVRGGAWIEKYNRNTKVCSMWYPDGRCVDKPDPKYNATFLFQTAIERFHREPRTFYNDVGFRCAMDATD